MSNEKLAKQVERLLALLEVQLQINQEVNRRVTELELKLEAVQGAMAHRAATW